MDAEHIRPGLSVVICTFNRAALMEGAARSLLEHGFSAERHELIIVDNMSTDATHERAESLAGQYPGVRVLKENKRGLSHARNCGWRAARGTYVGYLDDDALAPPDWLAVAEELVEQHAPAMFGGGYVPFYDSPKPAWFKDDYGSRTMADQAGPLPAHEHLCGGNMFARRDILEALGGYDPSLGMRGTRLAYGEENLLQDRIRSQIPNSLIYYEPRLGIRHLVRADKMSLPRRYQQAVAQGRDISRNWKLTGRRPGSGWAWATLAREVIKLAWLNTGGMITRDRRRYPFCEQYHYEVGYGRIKQISAAWNELKGEPE